MRLIALDSVAECQAWGLQHENGATTLVANIAALQAAGDGIAAVLFQRHDGHPYVHDFTIEGENLFITLNATDTQIVGKCELSISWVMRSRLKKKKSYQSFILPSDLEGDFPLTEESLLLLDQLKEYVEEARDLVATAEPELHFSDELPADGKSGKLYIEKDTSTVHYWDNERFRLLSGPRYDKVHGGIAHYDERDRCIAGKAEFNEKDRLVGGDSQQ